MFKVEIVDELTANTLSLDVNKSSRCYEDLFWMDCDYIGLFVVILSVSLPRDKARAEDTDLEEERKMTRTRKRNMSLPFLQELGRKRRRPRDQMLPANFHWSPLTPSAA